MGSEDRRRTVSEQVAMDASGALSGKRERAPDVVVETWDEPPGNQEAQCRVGDLHLAFVAGKEGVKVATQWWRSDLKLRRNATHDSAVKGVDASQSLHGLRKNVIERWPWSRRKRRKSRMGVWGARQRRGGSTLR